MKPIFDGIQRFQDDVFPTRREEFEALAKGQSPQLLLITCSDSRIDPALLTQSEPGDVFVIRNAGNIVAPASDVPSGEAATVEYAIRALRIRDIAVCGHSHCGAMAALPDEEATAALPAVRGWIEHGRPALDRQRELPGIEDPALRVVAANVLTQVDHLRTHRAVAEAEAAGDVTLHPWVYRIETGEVCTVVPGAGLSVLGDLPVAQTA